MIPAGAGPGEGIWPASRQLASLALRSGAVVAAATQPAAGGSPPRTPRAGSPVSGPASRMWLEVAADAGHGDTQTAAGGVVTGARAPSDQSGRTA